MPMYEKPREVPTMVRSQYTPGQNPQPKESVINKIAPWFFGLVIAGLITYVAITGNSRADLWEANIKDIQAEAEALRIASTCAKVIVGGGIIGGGIALVRKIRNR